MLRELEKLTLETAATADISARTTPELSVSTYELAYKCSVVAGRSDESREEETVIEVVSTHLLLSVVVAVRLGTEDITGCCIDNIYFVLIST